MQASATIYLDMRSKEKSTGYPVKVSVYFNYEKKRYSTGIDLTKADFERSYKATKPQKDFRKTRERLIAIEVKAKGIIENLKPFTFERFEQQFFGETRVASDVFGYYEDYITKLTKEDRLGTASNYQCSLKSIKTYLATTSKKANKKLTFTDVTEDFLNGYEKWMIAQGNSQSTIGIYLRPLRALYNMAIEKKEASLELYPFKKSSYQIPSSTKVKKALKLEHVEILYKAKLEKGSHMEKARDFWVFSYLCNGINVRDIAELKYQNITPDTISFIRTKTKGTTKGRQKHILAVNTDEIKDIISRYDTKTQGKQDYVFGIFNHGMNAIEKRKATQKFTRYINQHIKKLVRQLGLDEDISSNWARHSFATIADNEGINRGLIQESLGHGSQKITENYLNGFESAAKIKLAKSLLNFKK